jgi:multidrug efflux pump subunit AcrB
VSKLAYLRTVQDWVIRPQLRSVEGVAGIDSIGGYEKQFVVEPDPAKLASYHISFSELAEALEKAAADLRPAGTFRSANELAGLLRKLDQDMGWDLPDPAAAMVETTPTGAKRALAEVVRAASGNWYKKADVAALPDDLARAYLGAGPVVGLSTKLAALADPGRGATAEQLLRDQGVVPVDRDPHTRVDWAALARGA